MTTFLEYTRTILERRAEDGIRGIVSERNRVDLHIATAAFAGLELGDVRPPMIREWLRDMSKKKAHDSRGDRTLSTGTIARSFALVSTVFAEAVKDELVATNPCTGVKVAKKADAAATQDKFAYLTREEQHAFATCEAIPEATRLTIQFAFYTGLRQGEQFHLELADLHVDGDFPHVLVRFGSKGKPPKSGKQRQVPLVPQAIEVAKRWLEVLPTFAPSNPDGLVFPTAVGTRRGVGKPLARVRSGAAWVDGWKAARLAVGITRRFRWHDLRHSCASSLVAGWWGRQWTTEEVKEVLGHSSIVITQMYSHMGVTSLKEAARATVMPIVVSSPPSLAESVAPLRPLRRFGLYVSKLFKPKETRNVG